MQRVDEAIRRTRAEAAGGGPALAAAIASLRRLLPREGRHVGLHVTLAELLVRTGGKGEWEQAEYFAQKAVELGPASAEAHNVLGYVRLKSRRGAEAVGSFRRALEIEPRHMLALSNLCGALRGLGDLDGAVEAMERMVAAHGDSEFAYADANVLSQVGMPRRAAGILRGAVEGFPGSFWLRRDLCVALNYTDDATEEEVAGSHARLGSMLPRKRAVAVRDADAERVLRVGLLSPDFREHSVAAFVRPLVDCAGRGIVPVCYHAAAVEDAVTERVRRWAEAAGGEWRAVAGMGDRQIAERMRSDGIDVAVDLTGWTAGSRVMALAEGAAPVQATYLGYPNSTGMPAMDARLVDSATDPAGTEGWATERLMRMDPCFVCYSPAATEEHGPAKTLTGGTQADSARGSITFGSFNTIRKVTPTTIGLWARVLREVAASRILLKSPGLESGVARRHVLEQFSEHGVGEERVELSGRVESKAEHLAMYGRVDVALDTYPYHGTTTTCEALWMGVPVVSLVGPGHRSRVGLTLLRNVGLAELAVDSAEAFVGAAVGLARDAERRAALRAGLRQTMAASPLSDHRGAADRFAAAVRGLWRARLAEK